MLAVAFALSCAQAAEQCSSTDDVCLLQLKSNTDSRLAAQLENDTIALLSSETDSETDSEDWLDWDCLDWLGQG